MGKHLSIGAFADSVRLSVKALRRYDADGLLRPAVVDPDTGYRSYAPEQSRAAVAIAMLRGLDVPLAQVRALLGARSEAERRALLEAERRRLERALAAQREALASVERLLAAGSLFPYEVELGAEPERRVVSMSLRAPPEALEADTTRAVRELFALTAAEGLPAREPLQCLLTDPDVDGLRTLTVCLDLPEGTPRAPELRVERLPGGPCVTTRHLGSYASLGLAHFAVRAWARERSLAPVGPIREIYRNDPDEVADEALETDVRLLVAPP